MYLFITYYIFPFFSQNQLHIPSVGQNGQCQLGVGPIMSTGRGSRRRVERLRDRQKECVYSQHTVSQSLMSAE